MSTPTIDTRTWDTAEAELAQVLPGYESRDEQRELAHRIESAMTTGRHLAAEAGTGTGKSFAGLIPGIIHALKSGKSVVVATATKGLQGQYSLEDIPFLAEKLAKFWGTPVRTAELKGRGNYACLSKMADTPDVPYLQEMMAELNANPEHVGDLDRFTTVKVEPRDRGKLSSSSEECPGASSCHFSADCYAVKAASRARQAQLVITNHALLAVDLMISTPDHEGRPTPVLLPDYDVVIIDEAQEFESYMTNALGSRLTEGTFASLGTQYENLIDQPRASRYVAASATRFFGHMANLIGSRNDAARLDEKSLYPVRTDIEDILAELNGWLTQLAAIPAEGDDTLKTKIRRVAQRITSTMNKLSVLMPWDEDDSDEEAERRGMIGEVVRWTMRDNDRVTIGYSPLSVGNFLADRLWSHRTGILLSATLSNGKDFSYVPRMLGMTDYDSFDAGTPFDYPEQARIWIPRDMHPSKDRSGWLGLGHNATYELVKAAGGRALLLFTSRSAMNQRWDAIAEELDELDIPCRRQDAGVSADELIRWKNDNPAGVVFGLKSLMQGVSVKNPDSLHLVILDKMPFPVPSEVVFQARAEARDAEVMRAHHLTADKAKWHAEGAFFGMSVPEMMLVLKQAYGRLIRSRAHQGLMVVLDSRLHPQVGPGYGKTAFRNLPDATVLDSQREATLYLKGLNV